MKHHRELSIFLRVEVNALTTLLLNKGIITLDEFQKQVVREAEALDAQYMQNYPGFSTSAMGLHMKLPAAAETMKRMNFRP